MNAVAEIHDRILAELRSRGLRHDCATFCRFKLVARTPTRRTWQCSDCWRYIQAPVLRSREIIWRKRKREPNPSFLAVL